MTWNIQHGTGYLLCFDVPFGTLRPASDPAVAKFSHADHYLGITDNYSQRLRAHADGEGARLTGHVQRAGIGWTVTRLWEDINRAEEARLKAPGAAHWCPRCGIERVMSRDPVYQEVMTQARAKFSIAVDAAREARLHAGSKSAGTRLWNRARRDAQEELRATRRQAAADWLATHPNPGFRRASLRCLLEDEPVATSLTARRAAAERQAAAAQPDEPPVEIAAGDLDDPWGWPPVAATGEPAPDLAAAAVVQGSAGSAYDPEDLWSWPPPGGPDIEAA